MPRRIGGSTRCAGFERFARELVDDGHLSDATCHELHRTIGRARLFELTTGVGYYGLLALQLRVFQISAPGPAEPGRH